MHLTLKNYKLEKKLNVILQIFELIDTVSGLVEL
jgi:hypothetical protein